MQDIIILSLSLMENCMQSEGEPRFGIFLNKIFVDLDFKNWDSTNFVIQPRNTIHKRMNGVKSEKLT